MRVPCGQKTFRYLGLFCTEWAEIPVFNIVEKAHCLEGGNSRISQERNGELRLSHGACAAGDQEACSPHPKP